jgi:hypothetical protein
VVARVVMVRVVAAMVVYSSATHVVCLGMLALRDNVSTCESV